MKAHHRIVMISPSSPPKTAARSLKANAARNAKTANPVMVRTMARLPIRSVGAPCATVVNDTPQPAGRFQLEPYARNP
jgi:hypothetical protein